jgi:hypothetical protein
VHGGGVWPSTARICVALEYLRDEKMDCDMGTRVAVRGGGGVGGLSLDIRMGNRWVGHVNDVSHVQESV